MSALPSRADRPDSRPEARPDERPEARPDERLAVPAYDRGAAQPMGLRERKKRRARQAIQRAGLALMAERGFDQTTVEQIAAAADVSPSTVFRYFPTKEDLVLYDALDPVVVDAFRRQPAELSPTAALRRAFAEVVAAMGDTQRREQEQRYRLIVTVPAVRERWMGEYVRTQQLFASVLAERVGRDPDDVEVRIHVGALLGAVLAVSLPVDPAQAARAAISDPFAPEAVRALDAAFQVIEDGLPLLARPPRPPA